MAKTIIVAGYGPGTSNAVAEKFGAEGFQVALVARNAERLAAGVKALAAKGVKAEAFTADFSDPALVKKTVGQVREKLGAITAISWTCYDGSAAGDLLTATGADITRALGIATTSLVAAVQAALTDLKAEKGGVLVTNGGLGFFDPQMDAMAAQYNVMGLAIANAAKHKLVGILSTKLKADGVYVGEIMVAGAVKGTSFDQGQPAIEPSTIANKFWQLYTDRKDTYATVS